MQNESTMNRGRQAGDNVAPLLLLFSLSRRDHSRRYPLRDLT